ncbi:MAG: amidohydrolase family protein [Acidobacteria bacterium]|nr:amidohydrolase family protein [Acidobacteriota bacterium]
MPPFFQRRLAFPAQIPALRVLLALPAVITLLSPIAAVPLPAATLIHAGSLIDGISDQVRNQVTIVIDGDRIAEIRQGFSAPGDDDTVIDLKDAVVMPGLMDMHVHLTGELSPNRYLERVQLNTATFAVRSVEYARRTLMAGFTTVRNPGDDGTITVALRNEIAKGMVPGPRIFTAGKSLATTGGHADPTNGLRADLTRDAGPKDGVVNGPDDAAKAVRHRYKEGADFIKLTATGGVLSVAKSGQNPQFSEEELRAIVTTANDYGFHVAAHAHGAEGMKRAIRAGVRSIEHGTLMDQEVMDLMKEHGTYYVPTILAGVFVAEKAEIDGYFPELVRPKAAEIGPKIHATFGKAYRAGVKIAFGTDSGVSPHGENAREFALMVSAGMPPMEAIQAATMAAAELLGIQDELGSVEVGKIADLVAVRGDPLEDISVLETVAFVMKEGAVYKDER